LVTVVKVIVTLVPSQTSLAEGGVNAKGMPHSTIRLSAQVMCGGVVSTIVTVWLQNAILVQVSETIQVCVARKVFPQKLRALVTGGPTGVIVTFVPSQISTAVGVVKVKDVPHSRI